MRRLGKNTQLSDFKSLFSCIFFSCNSDPVTVAEAILTFLLNIFQIQSNIHSPFS